MRKRELAFAELMIPIVKGWNTEIAQQTAYLGVQVHGGMGYIEESGAAQYARDARITTIYEGTTGIQANDLIGRKIARDGGKALLAAIERMRGVQEHLAAAGSDELAVIGKRVRAGRRRARGGSALDRRAPARGSACRPRRCGTVPRAGRHRLRRRRARRAARSRRHGDSRPADGDADFLRAKIATSRHFAEHCLTKAPGLRDTIVAGAESVLALAEAQF